MTGNIYNNQKVLLDGQVWEKCIFRNCVLIVSRGNFGLRGCEFHNCDFDFTGEALNILAWFFSTPPPFQAFFANKMRDALMAKGNISQ